MQKSPCFYLIATIFSYLLISCTTSPTSIYDQKELSNNLIVRPTVTVPVNSDKNDIFYDQETLDWLRSMMASHPNGLSASINPAYKNMYADWDYTFFVSSEDDFVGEILLGNGRFESSEVAVICLLDFIQIPCTPDSSKELIVSVPSRDFLTLPISFSVNVSGLHDLDLIVIRDPYDDSLGATGESSRYSVLSVVSQNNILVDNDTTPYKAIEPITPEVRESLHGGDILTVSSNHELYDELGNIPQWIVAEGNSGDTLDFYLHFNSDVRDEDDDIIAVTAFINYEQVPLYFHDESYQSLYIRREKGSWQIVPVSIRLPDTPGTYELVVIGRTDVLTSVELALENNDAVDSEESKRIELIVHE